MTAFATARAKAATTAIAATLAAAIALVPATPALAWGEREQSFVAGVAAAVLVDELLKQNRRAKQWSAQPAPAPAPRPHHPHPTPVYQPAPVSIYQTPAARAFNSYSRSERQAIQRQLARYGYYRSGIDGAFGPGTYNAVLAYARDAGASANLSSTAGTFAVYDGLLF